MQRKGTDRKNYKGGDNNRVGSGGKGREGGVEKIEKGRRKWEG